MDPPSNTLGSRLVGKITGWFAAEPERIPLFPVIDMNRAPRSNPLKRRLPPDFLTEVPPARKVVKLSDDGPKGMAPGSTTVAVDLGPGPGPRPAGSAAVAPPAGGARSSPAGVARPPPPPLKPPPAAAAAAAAGIARTSTSPGARIKTRTGGRKTAPGVLKKAGALRTPKHAISFNLPDTPPSPPPSATQASFHGAAGVNPLPAHHQPSPARRTTTTTMNASKPPWPQTMTPRLPTAEKRTTSPWPQTMTPRPPRVPVTPPLRTPTPSPSPSALLSTLVAPLHPAEAQALRLLRSAFPEGWERIPVSASGLECGLRAVAASAAAQHQGGPTTTTTTPTTAELRAVFFGSSQQAANAAADLANTNNFTVDQLAGVLHRWRRSAAADGRGVAPQRLHLGVVFDDRVPFILWDDSDEDNDGREGNPHRPRPHPDDKIVWIHTDDHERRYDDESRQPGDDTVILSHYSGLRRKDNPFGPPLVNEGSA